MVEGCVGESILPKPWRDARGETHRHGPLPTGSGAIRHEQIKGLSPRATVGVVYHDERLQCHSVKIQKSSNCASHLEVVLTQGTNREIRGPFKAWGHEGRRRRRSPYGPLKLEALPSGAWRGIPTAEVRQALRLSELVVQLSIVSATGATGTDETSDPSSFSRKSRESRANNERRARSVESARQLSQPVHDGRRGGHLGRTTAEPALSSSEATGANKSIGKPRILRVTGRDGLWVCGIDRDETTPTNRRDHRNQKHRTD